MVISRAGADGQRPDAEANRILNYVTEAARWAEGILDLTGWPRQVWSCPEDPRHLAARLLAAAARGQQSEAPVALSSAPIRRCSLFIGRFAVETIGTLVTKADDIILGRYNADVELHLLYGDKDQAQGVRRAIRSTQDIGWSIYGRFIIQSQEDWTYAVLCIRDEMGRFLLYDQSFAGASENLRLWAIKSVRRNMASKMTGPAVGFNDVSDTNSLNGDLARALKVRYPRDKATIKVAFYVGSMAIVGGLERWVVSMVAAFARIGISAYVISFARETPAAAFDAELKGLHVSLGGDAGRLTTVLRDAEIDILLLNHVYEGVHAVVDDVICYEVLHNIYFWQRNNDTLVILRRSFRGIISISAVVSEYALRYLDIDRERLIEIPHGLDRTGLIRPTVQTSLTTRLASPLRFVQVANLYPQKNTLALVMAFAHAFGESPHVALDIVGGLAHAELAGLVRDFIDCHNLTDRVTLLGSVDRHRLGRVYSGASVFCFPSLHEGYGLAILEAMYYDLPMIVFNTGHAAQLTSFGNGIVVSAAYDLEELDETAVVQRALAPRSDDVEKLSNALLEVAENYSQYHHAAQEAGVLLRRTNTIDNVAEAYAVLFHKAITSSFDRDSLED